MPSQEALPTGSVSRTGHDPTEAYERGPDSGGQRLARLESAQADFAQFLQPLPSDPPPWLDSS